MQEEEKGREREEEEEDWGESVNNRKKNVNDVLKEIKVKKEEEMRNDRYAKEE